MGPILRSSLIKLSVAALLFALSPRPALAEDDVRIVSLVPPTNRPLRAGDTVTFEIKVQIDSDRSAAMRWLGVGFYRGRERGAEPLAEWTEVVPNGRSIRTFKSTFRVPVTGQISVEALTSDGKLASLGKRALSWDAKDYSVVDTSGKKIKAASEANDKVTITSITPVSGATLRAGDSITFDLKADYELRSAETGRVVWVLAGSGDVHTILSSMIIQKGRGVLSFSRTVQILPGLGAQPTAVVLLLPKGFVRWTAFDRQNFRVEQSAEDTPNALSQIRVDVTGEFEDHLKITSISPSRGMPLRGGETIDFRINVEYEIGSVDAAELMVTFGTVTTFAEASIPSYARDTRIIEKGRGSVMVTRRLWIPTGLNGRFPITVRLTPPANATDTVTYKIAP